MRYIYLHSTCTCNIQFWVIVYNLRHRVIAGPIRSFPLFTYLSLQVHKLLPLFCGSRFSLIDHAARTALYRPETTNFSCSSFKSSCSLEFDSVSKRPLGNIWSFNSEESHTPCSNYCWCVRTRLCLRKEQTGQEWFCCSKRKCDRRRGSQERSSTKFDARWWTPHFDCLGIE